ncbi:MAG: 3-oxoacyl-ACP synthase, partial [Achromobacter pestifer]
MDTAMKYSAIAGTGSFLPERVVSNDELAAELATRDIATSDEWIVERTGIRQRHLAERGVTTS